MNSIFYLKSNESKNSLDQRPSTFLFFAESKETTIVMGNMKTSDELQNVYDKQYTWEMAEWRKLGAKYKVQNILNTVGNQTFNRVLEYGAGDGIILDYLDKEEQFKELNALEISDSGIEAIKNRNLSKINEIRKFDGYNSGFSDNEFDLVYCSHVLEHVEHPRLVLREIERISKHQVFEVPLDYSKNVDEKMEHYLGYGHINIFTPALFKFLLKSEGYKIESQVHSVMNQEVMEYMWFVKDGIKKTPINRFKAYLLGNKLKFSRMVLGKKYANEFYGSAFTCKTVHSGELKIF